MTSLLTNRFAFDLISPEDRHIDQTAKVKELQTTGKAVASNEKLGELDVTGQATSRPIAEEVAISKELEKLKVRIGGVDIWENEATFIFELKGVDAALALIHRLKSETFYCRGEFEFS